MPTVKELAASLDAEVRGDADTVILDAQAIEKAGASDITFAGDEANLRKLADSKAGAVIVSRKHADLLQQLPKATAVLLVDDSAAAFIQVIQSLRPQRPRPAIGISPQAFVSPSARIGAGTNVYPGASIADEVSIGANCDVHSGVCIGPGCRIGDNVTLFPNVVLYADVVIGDHVRIHASSVIGADGFGYRFIDGRHAKIPHFGTVRIDDHVEIGAATTIDRAMIGETVIGEGTKIDNQVMIAHNCELGRHNILVSQVGFAGSSSTGDYVVCAGQVGVADHVHVGTGAVLGSRSAVNKDVPAGQTYIGMPAMPAAEAMKLAMAQKKIPEMRKTLKQLESRIAELTGRLDRLSPPDRESEHSAA